MRFKSHYRQSEKETETSASHVCPASRLRGGSRDTGPVKSRTGTPCRRPAQGHSADAPSPPSAPGCQGTGPALSERSGQKPGPQLLRLWNEPAEAGADLVTLNAVARIGGSPLMACPQPLQPGFGCPATFRVPLFSAPTWDWSPGSLPLAHSWGASRWMGRQDTGQQDPGIV